MAARDLQISFGNDTNPGVVQTWAISNEESQECQPGDTAITDITATGELLASSLYLPLLFSLTYNETFHFIVTKLSLTAMKIAGDANVGFSVEANGNTLYSSVRYTYATDTWTLVPNYEQYFTIRPLAPNSGVDIGCTYSGQDSSSFGFVVKSVKVKSGDKKRSEKY